MLSLWTITGLHCAALENPNQGNHKGDFYHEVCCYHSARWIDDSRYSFRNRLFEKFDDSRPWVLRWWSGAAVLAIESELPETDSREVKSLKRQETSLQKNDQENYDMKLAAKTMLATLMLVGTISAIAAPKSASTALPGFSDGGPAPLCWPSSPGCPKPIPGVAK